MFLRLRTPARRAVTAPPASRKHSARRNRRTSSGNHSSARAGFGLVPRPTPPPTPPHNVVVTPGVTTFELDANGALVLKPGKRVITFTPNLVHDTTCSTFAGEKDCLQDLFTPPATPEQKRVTPLDETSLRSRAALGIITPAIIKLDHFENTWDGENISYKRFDAMGRLIEKTELVDCDKEWCECNKNCECPYPQFVETRLRCDGTFVQKRLHGEMDDEGRVSLGQMAAGKHGIILEACAELDCHICEGHGMAGDFLY